MNCNFIRMNYLAHAYLSFGHPEILVGNMISDFVKGRAKFGYTVMVQKGITLHRAIDAFTDEHPATLSAKEIFRPHYRLYSAPLMDIIYDYFLANDRSYFSQASLLSFTQSVYRTLEDHTAALPPRFLLMLTYMKAENWLWNYQYPQGIQRSLRGLVRRSSFITDGDTAYELLMDNRQQLQEYYAAFIKDVKEFAKQKFDELLA